MPKAYNYDETTKIYKGEIDRQRDPVRSQKLGYDVWLMPANSTDIPPLEPKDGFDVVWNGSMWEYQEKKKDDEPKPYEPTEEEKREQVRGYRNWLLQSTDFSQLDDVPLDDAEKAIYREYRQYLRDYTNGENWWEENPMEYKDWVVAHHPVSE
ncbi:MAG: hypothetical protein II843_01325 [Alphaproteobacteria bacterium]|nr:hypothetical protein [Alphaproteobacteria bacterium]